MTVNIFLTIIILLCLTGILLIITKRIFYLVNIDLDKIPQEIAAKTKKELLKKRINRQISELTEIAGKNVMRCGRYCKDLIRLGTCRVRNKKPLVSAAFKKRISNVVDNFKKLVRIVKK